MTINVIGCLDHSVYGEAVLAAAAWAAKSLSAPLVLKHVLEKAPQVQTDFSGSIGLGAQESLLQELASLEQQRARIQLEKGRLLLDSAKSLALSQGCQDVTESLRHDDLVESLLAAENDSRLFVVGKRGSAQTGSHGLLGVHVERLLRTVHRPVLLVQQQFQVPVSFMIAFDGSATMIKNITVIASSALLKGMPCHLVMVNQASAVNSKAQIVAADVLRQAGFAVSVAELSGDADSALELYAQQHAIDLMVMGAYGHSKIRHLLLGSTTTSVLQKAKLPVLVLR